MFGFITIIVTIVGLVFAVVWTLTTQDYFFSVLVMSTILVVIEIFVSLLS